MVITNKSLGQTPKGVHGKGVKKSQIFLAQQCVLLHCPMEMLHRYLFPADALEEQIRGQVI
jgi:hypothetical protein